MEEAQGNIVVQVIRKTSNSIQVMLHISRHSGVLSSKITHRQFKVYGSMCRFIVYHIIGGLTVVLI